MPRPVSTLLATVILAAVTGTAPAALSQQPPAAAVSAPRQNWVVGGMTRPDDWQYVMGPTDQPEMSLKLIKTIPAGVIGFACRTDGTESVGLAMKGIGGKPGDTIRFEVTIGTIVHVLDMVVQPPGPGGLGAFQYDGPGVPAMLQAMGSADAAYVLTMRFDDKQGHQIDFELPTPRDLASVPAAVCKGWADNVAGSKAASDIPPAASTDASTVHIPASEP